MTGLADFCVRLGIDPAAAGAALSAGAGRDDAPWYMQVVLGLGAWVTAIASLIFVWAVLYFIFDIDEPDAVVAAIGAAVFAVGLWLVHIRPDGAFMSQAAIAFATEGTILAAIGIGAPQESLWAAAAATLPFAAAAVWQQRSQLLQFLVVSVALIAGLLAAWEEWSRVVTDVSALALPIGVLLLLYPPRRDVRAAALAMLVVPALATIAALDLDPGTTLWQGWPARLIHLAVFGFLFHLNWRRLKQERARTIALSGGVLAVATAILLPSGSAAALVLLLLAYTLGSRTLAVLGALAEVYFIWKFYADLQSTLLTKSVILLAVGAALLLCYGLIAAADRRRATP